MELEIINLQGLQSHGRAFWVTRMMNWPVMPTLCIAAEILHPAHTAPQLCDKTQQYWATTLSVGRQLRQQMHPVTEKIEEWYLCA